jgi:aldehyde:ferredoxin oxidoreductase
MMKCYSKLTYVMGAMTDNLEFGFKIAGDAQGYGVDGYTTPQVMAFAIELYENGILTDKDLPRFPSKNEERFFYLLEKIVRREGIGDILADGVYWAARKIGKGAEEYDHNTIKKQEQIPIKLGMLNPIYYIMWSTGEKVNITQIEGQLPQAPFPTRELREDFVRDWPQVPTGKEERFKQFILEWGDEGKALPYWPPIDLVCELVEWQETMHYIDDATGICAGLSSFPLKPPYHIHNLPHIISSATGLDIDEDRLWEIAKRNRNLLRAINIRRGMRRKDERPPDDHWKKRFPEFEAQVHDEYYKFKGWNNDGIPTKETLDELGLDYVSQDFEQRGVYEEKKVKVAKQDSTKSEKERVAKKGSKKGKSQGKKQ